MPSPLVPFVGRAAEVAAVAAALDAAAAGAASVIAVAGEPGVGKSRLVEEADALARAQGFLTLRATASPLHADLPYGIVVEALRPIMRTVEAGARTRLVEGLPDLGRLFDGLNLPAAVPLGDAAMERTRLFEAVCRLFDRLTGQQPVLLVVDDLHWADPTSLALLDYVVRGLADRRFLLLVTHRTGAVPEMEVFRRSGSFRAIALEPLDAAEVGAFAHGLLADDPPATLTTLLIERTGGLPLFVRSLVTMLIDSGRLFRSGGRWVLGPEPVDDVPPELVGLLRSRLDALQAGDRHVFDTVAVAGGRVDHALLAGLHRDEDELLGCLKRLRGAGLLVEELGEAGVHYEVTHPLLSEVAYSELPTVARRRTHAIIAAALQRLARPEVGRLAHHVRGAGDEVDPHAALDVLMAATDAALDAKAGAEAATHADAAIALALRQGRMDLLLRLRAQRAEALELAGPGDAAIDGWRAAVDAATSIEDRTRRLQRLAIVEWDAGRLADSQIHIEEAVAALGGMLISPLHLAVLETQGRMLARRGQLTELRTVVSELDHLADATDSPRARVFARWAEVDLCLYDGDHDGAERAVTAMMRLAREENSVLLLEEAHRPAVCNAMAWGDHVTARRMGEEARLLAREIGVPALEILVSVFLAFVDFVSGNWDEATAVADRVLADSHRTGMRRGAAAALCLRALVHTRRGEHGDATACLREGASLYAEGFADDRHLLSIGDVCRTMIFLGRGDGESALRVARSIQPSGLANPALCLGVLGEAQVAVGDPAGARETATSLARHGPDAPYPAAVAARILGLAARAEGDAAAASEAFGRATKGFDALAMPFDAAVARLDRAEIDGADHLRDDLALFDRLGARPAADRARQLLRRLGVRPTVASRTRQADELSPREAEIAQLVAEGLSNMEIAERLFISHRTVTTHLQRIYQRLGVGSRTGLTRYVLEHPRNT